MEQDQDVIKIPEYSNKISTRHPDPDVDKDSIIGPRLGRRESEPHSQEIMFLYDVLSTNFTNCRTLWDLHHYFNVEGLKFDIQFDISLLKDFQISNLLSSYNSAEYKNRIPDLAINILSKATYKSDVGENVDICKILQIPIYIIFCSHPIGSSIYQPPFLRVYILNEKGEYIIHESRSYVISEDDNDTNWNSAEIIDTSKLLPFRVGLMKMKRKLNLDQPTYRMVLIDPDKNIFYKTRADQEKSRADQEKARAEDYKNQLAQYQKKFGTL